MQLLDLTLDTPAENLALDEALLDAAEQATQTAKADAGDQEVLRIWEPHTTMVVVGSSTRVADEVNLDACKSAGIPVLRRASGGTTIVTGSGCLMYALVLSYQKRPQLRDIDRAHQYVLETIAAALSRALLGATGSTGVPSIGRKGISDLALNNRKFSGNSLRCKRRFLLYHGTLLYRFPLDQICKVLKMPSRQPNYRVGRSHDDFLINLPLDAATLRRAFIEAFGTEEPCDNWPRELTAQLFAEKYNQPEWNQRM